MKNRFYVSFICSSCGEKSRVRTDYIKHKKTDKCNVCNPPPKGFRENNSNWRGGTTKHTEGYLCVYLPEHEHASQTGYITEHRLVMEKYLGRILTKEEVVHHRDGNRLNNRINNLILFPSNSAHQLFHNKEKRNAV